MVFGASTVSHPAPARYRVGWLRQLVAFLGAPTIWAGQMIASEILSSYACYPHRSPLFILPWPWLQPALAAISLAAFLVALCCAYIAWVSWKRSRHEAEGESKRATETGEGRTRFLALVSLYTSGLFLIAIIFTAFSLVLVSPC